MHRFLVIVTLGLFFTGCVRDDEINLDELIFDCVSSDFEIQEKSSCDSTADYDPFYFCEYRNLGDVFLLSSSRGHLKYMCPVIQKAIFEDNGGNELSLDISTIATQYATQWSEPCEGNPNKSILYCSANEEAQAILTNDSAGIEFRIMLIVERRDENESQDDRDRLFITVPRYADFGVYYSLVLSYYIKRGNIYESFNNWYSYEEELVLHGKTFQNVTYVIPTVDEGDTEIYYAEKYGIVGFRDERGVLWTFKRYG